MWQWITFPPYVLQNEAPSMVDQFIKVLYAVQDVGICIAIVIYAIYRVERTMGQFSERLSLLESAQARRFKE